MTSSISNRRSARAYSRAQVALKIKYPKEFQTYFENEAWGTTREQKYKSALRHLRFRHPIVFKRLYTSFKEMEEA